jgi:hypothetical protein
MRVTNAIPLGSPLLLPVDTVNCVQTRKALPAVNITDVPDLPYRGFLVDTARTRVTVCVYLVCCVVLGQYCISDANNALPCHLLTSHCKDGLFQAVQSG